MLEDVGVVRASKMGRESQFALDPRAIDDARPISKPSRSAGTGRCIAGLKRNIPL